MIESSGPKEKHDRLAAFLQAYGLRAYWSDTVGTSNLVIGDADGNGSPTHLIYRPYPLTSVAEGMQPLALAQIDFSGAINPLVGALPEELHVDLGSEPQLQGLVTLIVAERRVQRCGGGTIFARLCEVVVVLAVRKAIAIGTVNAGLLAGLAHHDLHPALVAIHDQPGRPWRLDELAELAGMKRGRFIEMFKQIVGRPPAAYMTEWRLSLARVHLREGQSVKAVATRVGFGSAAAFSRAFSRLYGYPPHREGNSARRNS